MRDGGYGVTTGRVLEPDAGAGGVTAVCRLRRKDGTRGPIVPWYDLEFAEAAAASSAEPGQPPVEQVASLLPRTLDDVARLVRQRSPTAVVLAADDDTIGAAQLLAQRFEVPVIIESRPRSPLAQACGVVASAWASPYLDDAAATSPYLHAGTPATAAPVLGVRAAWQRDRAVAVRAIQAVAEDLRLLDGQLPAGSTVPVIGSGVVLEAGGLGPSELPWRGLRRVRPAPVVTLAQADRLLDGGTAIKTPLLRVVVTPRPGDAQRLRRVVIRAAGVGIDVEVVVDLDSASATADVVAGHPTKGTGAADPPDVVLHAARSVLEVAPEADLVAPQPVLERLERAGAAADTAPRPAWWLGRRAAMADRRHRMARCVSGRYERAVAVVEAAEELWWEHADDPARHADWLSSTVSTSGLVLRVVPDASAAGDPDGDAAPLAARLSIITATDTADGRRLSSSAGTLLERPYHRAADTAPSEPTLLRLDEPEDLERLLSHADEAATTGELAPGLLHPLSLLTDVCAVGGIRCAGPRLPRLVVGADGLVRTSRCGPAIGAIGDPLPDLRSEAAEARDRGAGCTCRPILWPADALEHLRVRPWIARMLSAASAVKALWPGRPSLARSESLAAVRVRGLHEGVRPWPGSVALVTVDDRVVLHETTSGRTLALPPLLAGVVEALLREGLDGARATAEELTGDPQHAERALQGAIAALDRLKVRTLEAAR